MIYYRFGGETFIDYEGVAGCQRLVPFGIIYCGPDRYRNLDFVFDMRWRPRETASLGCIIHKRGFSFGFNWRPTWHFRWPCFFKVRL
jgi:hypothetical protein